MTGAFEPEGPLMDLSTLDQLQLKARVVRVQMADGSIEVFHPAGTIDETVTEKLITKAERDDYAREQVIATLHRILDKADQSISARAYWAREGIIHELTRLNAEKEGR
jgi:hypothetical protein